MENYFLMQSIHADKLTEKMSKAYGDYGVFKAVNGNVYFEHEIKHVDPYLLGEIRHYAEGYNSALDDIATLEAENAKLRAALKDALAKPHPTWCKARQGGDCTCYKTILVKALEAK